MTKNKIDPVFASQDTGLVDTQTVYATYAASGLGESAVRSKCFNKLHNLAQERINDLIWNSPPACEDKETAVKLGIYAKDNCYGPGDSLLNRVVVGTSTSQIATAWPTKINGVRRVLSVDHSTTDIELTVIDPSDMSVDEVVDLSAGLGAGTWYTEGVCADETNAYVVFRKSTQEQYVQAYRMSDWSVASGWPAAGTQYGTGATTSPLNPVKIINADADYIAIASNNALVGTREMISLVDKSDGTISDTGNGDSTATGAQVLKDLCSNGENLFFYIDGELCSASIADLTSGCGGTDWPWTVSGGGGTAVAGDTIVSVGANATSDATILIAKEHQSAIATITSDDDHVLNRITGEGNCCFDGLNFWFLGRQSISGTNKSTLFKINLERVDTQDETTTTVITTDIEKYVTPYTFWLDDIFNPTNSFLHHDGRDLWFGGCECDTSSGLRERVFRFPLTHWR